MHPKVSWPIIITGVIYAGMSEHAGIITRVIEDVDTTVGPALVNATMFPEGGWEQQPQQHIALYDSKAAALAAVNDPRRKAYWAANS